LDGSDIIETTIFNIELSKLGVETTFFAPTQEIEESFIYTKKEVDKREERYPHIESTRMTRVPVKPIQNLSADLYDALIIPGGYGALRNLSDYLRSTPQEFKINKDFSNIINNFHKSGKYIVCGSPASYLIAKILGTKAGKVQKLIERRTRYYIFKYSGVTVGIYAEGNSIEEIKAYGSVAISKTLTDEIVIDEKNKIISIVGGTTSQIGQTKQLYLGINEILKTIYSK
jgi:enhancing lycopene biosynthesis protein 2